MDAYDDMHPQCAWKSLVRPFRCEEGEWLYPVDRIAEIVIFRCQCGHTIEKTQMEIELYGAPSTDTVVPCPKRKQQ